MMEVLFWIFMLLTIFAGVVAIGLLLFWCAYLIWAETQNEYKL